MPTSYKTITDGILRKIKTYDFLDLSESQLDEILLDYLRPAIVRFRVCRQDLSDRDDDAGSFNITLSDIEIEILINYAFIAFLESNYINVPTLSKVYLNSKDFHVLHQKDIHSGLLTWRNECPDDVNRMVSAYGYSQCDIFKVAPKVDVPEDDGTEELE